MVFWGVFVKPGNPYTHKYKQGGGRLRISQATLAVGKATLRSSVQCNVGEKRPVLLCALLPNKTESLQLDLEFNEAEDIVFSVIGPRGIYLTGYYVGNTRISDVQDDSESYGEDIESSEMLASNDCSSSEYGGSFINDDEPEPFTPSPVSSSRDDDEELTPKKGRNNGGLKRLKKRYQSVKSDDDLIVQDTDEEDGLPISTLCMKLKTDKEKATADVEKAITNKEDTHELKTVISPVAGSNDIVDVELMEDEEEKKGGHLITSEVIPENKPETDQKPNDTIFDISLEVLDSTEGVLDKNSKVKKKRKEFNTDATDGNLFAGNQKEDDQQNTDKSSCLYSNQLAIGNVLEEKKVKTKRRKTSKTNEIEQNKNAEKETGLVIEDLVTGCKPEGKVAVTGRKVKVNYVLKLKENGIVIDSKSLHKFRLGDKEVIEGLKLNVGLDGMRVGDKRRLGVPPSMSVGYKGTGENIPANSWLEFDVEMISIR